jgi:hypothetical protein
VPAPQSPTTAAITPSEVVQGTGGERSRVMPMVVAMSTADEGGIEMAKLSITFVTRGSEGFPHGRLSVGTLERSRLVLEFPIDAPKIERGRFGEHISFPLSDLPPDAREWFRRTPVEQVIATYE